MTNSTSHDPFDLARFIEAQQDDYQIALTEVQNGRKVSHWMWYIFPQLRELGRSSTAQHYGISGEAEARAFMQHAILGPRLIEICEAALSLNGQSARSIFGTPDDLKLRSCATLFAHISQSGSVFHQVVDKYFEGEFDQRTLELLSID